MKGILGGSYAPPPSRPQQEILPSQQQYNQAEQNLFDEDYGMQGGASGGDDYFEDQQPPGGRDYFDDGYGPSRQQPPSERDYFEDAYAPSRQQAPGERDYFDDGPAPARQQAPSGQPSYHNQVARQPQPRTEDGQASYNRQPPPQRARREAQPYSYQASQRPVRQKAAPPRYSGTTTTKQKGSVGGWVLLGVLLLLLTSAATLLVLVLTGRFSIGGSAPKIDPANPVLAMTNDAGGAYVEETLFIGDSNTLRLSNFGLVNPGFVAAQESIGVAGVTDEPFLMVSGQEAPITIEKTVELMKPKRILIMMGTNDMGNMTVEQFIQNYRNSLEGLKAASPKTLIVVAGIPPIGQTASNTNISGDMVVQFNGALQVLCGEMGIPFLETQSVLAGPDGYLNPAYDDGDGIHINQAGMAALLLQYRTHAWKP